ncbi:CoA ester lyase [Thalassotalea psychrophila]|uniref:CoA ester lyase n=1 Tax=Thalassotalea psychrophila TaxID=3065647 RepID=A0ABY9TU97_9GAMM|nr:CoA ester lyase [Colwelliaceae bacterium SQ149]
MPLPMLRSLLFVPGSRPDRFEKAANAGSDIICIDLEDAVMPADKAQARASVVKYLATNNNVVVRINHILTATGIDDLTALINAENSPMAIMLPKTSCPTEIDQAVAIIGTKNIEIIALLESVAGVNNSQLIAACDQVSALMFGGADYSAEIGAEFSYEPLLLARSQLVQAKAVKAIQLIDVPHIDIKQLDDLQHETAKVKALGFTAKAAIHPCQLDAIHQEFTPSELEVHNAEEIVSQIDNEDAGVLVINGRMIDRPIILAAKRTIALAQAASKNL